MTKTAFVAIVGKPNVGKSSLLNKMLGQKIAIVSSKPQTTRTKIMVYLQRVKHSLFLPIHQVFINRIINSAKR